MPTRPLRHTLACIAAAALVACGGQSEQDLLANARGFVDKREHKAAVVQLKSVLQKNPQSPEARYLMGQSLLELGDPVAATVELRKARDLKFDEARVVPALARSLLFQGDARGMIQQFATTTLADPKALAELKVALATAYYLEHQREKAEAEVAAALAAVPGHVGARLVQARASAEQGNLTQAREQVKEVLAADPSSAEGWMLEGELLLAISKDRKGAVEAFRKAIAAKPDLLQAHVAAVTGLFFLGDVAGAKEQVAQMKKRFPNQPRTKLFEAELAFNDKDYKAALEHVLPVVQALPNNALALQIAGAAEFRLGALQQAETYLGKALQLQAELPLARRILAQTYLRTGQAQKALTTLHPVLQKNNDPVALQLAAEAHLQAGEAEQAEKLFERAAKLTPNDPRIRTALALSQYNKGNTQGAIAELEAVASTDTGALAELALVSAHLRKNEVDKALKVIDALEKKQPTQPLAPMLRGRVLVLKKDPDGARRNFERALALDKLYFPAAAGLAALDVATNKVADARKHFDALIAADPNHTAAKQALATLLIRTGHTGDEVLKLLTSAVKQSPTDVRAQLMLVNFHLDRRDAKAALAAAQEANAALVDHPEILMAQGRAYLAANDMQQAITTFNRMAVVAPKSVQPHLGLADAHMALKDRAAAARSLKRALEIEPRMVQAQRSLAALAMADRQPARALEIAREVQKQHPTESVGHILEGDVETMNKNLPQALAAYQAATRKANPQEAATRVHATMQNMGQTAEAEQFAQRWIAEHATDAVFPFYLADQALAKKDYAQAETRYRKVVELQPNNALALNNIAWVMVQQGKGGAVAFAEKANQLLPGRPQLMDTLATALAHEKQLPKALELQKQAVERAPDDGSLRVNLAKLYIQSDQKAMARVELERVAKLGRQYGNQDEVQKLLGGL